MKTMRQIGDLRPLLRQARAGGKTIGFVPTMGALHEGHLALMRESRNRDDLVVASIYVNPTQFSASEDLDRYPRDIERDAGLAEKAGVDILFVPIDEEIYPPGHATVVDVKSLGRVLEGSSRPGHFRGVSTIVLKLFNIVAPDTAYFGEKDAQQLAVVRRLVEDLHLSVQIVAVPTVRDDDGVALSSRNHYLSGGEREVARRIPAALEAARRAVADGERSAVALRESVLEVLGRGDELRVDYVGFVDPSTFALTPTVERETLLVLAVWVGSTRLIDNTRLSGTNG